MKKIIKLSLIQVAIIFFSLNAFPQAGTLDPSFDGDGIAMFSIGTQHHDVAHQVKALADNTLLICGISMNFSWETSGIMMKVLQDGSLDMTWGTNGLVEFQFGVDTYPYNMEILDDDKILLSGTCYITASNSEFFVARFNPDGTPDYSFNTTGYYLSSYSSSEDACETMVIQEDGKIVLAGRTYSGAFSQLLFMRINADGTIDNTFGFNGYTMIDASVQHERINSLGVLSNGTIVGLGYGYLSSPWFGEKVFMAKLDQNGNPMGGFGQNGVLVPEIFTDISKAYCVKVMNDELYVSGWMYDVSNNMEIFICKLDSMSVADPNFGTGGITLTQVNPLNVSYELMLAPDGKIYSCGTTGLGGMNARDFILLRYDINGLPDLSFNNVGYVTTTIRPDWDEANSLDMQADGKIVLAGMSSGISTSGDNDITLTRYLNNITPTTQTIILNNGFQFVSSNILPTDPDMLIVLNEILNENLLFVRSSNGAVFRKIGPNWVNGIGDWVTAEGYLFKMAGAEELILEGTRIDPQTPINIETGYQFVSYFPETPMDALEAFATIIGDDLDFIRNSTGGMLRKIGPNWVNGIGDANTGEGYLIKMFADDELIYPGSSSFTCGDVFTDPRDEQMYNTVQIGEQCWMSENLNFGTMIMGTEEMTNNGIDEKYCFDNDLANCETYGGLYQWDEIMQYASNPGAQGICPEGWYIPTDSDYKILEGIADSQYPVGDPIWDESGWRGFDVGLNLRSQSGWSVNGTDAVGFTLLPGGGRNVSGTFFFLGIYATLWTSSEDTPTHSWWKGMWSPQDDTYRNYETKLTGMSIRCIKDNYSKVYNPQSSDKNHNNLKASMFSFVGGNPAEPVYTIYVSGLNIGDEVAAFDGDKMIGATKIVSDNTFENELPVFSTLTNGVGYEAGNPITLKVWSDNNFVSADFTSETIYDSYVSDVYPEGDGKYSVVNIKGSHPQAEEVISIYPNPASDLINIVSSKEIKSISIFNSVGQLVYTGKEGLIKTNNFEPGIYFIRIETTNSIETKKVTIR
jgi:uncharacterized protein (TIGR02145 family)/uncharacterized delta-60 repeat protein